RQAPEEIHKEKQLGGNRGDRRGTNNAAQTVNSHHCSRRETSLKQPNPMHRHEQHVHSAKRQQEKDFAERFIQPPPKNLWKPEEECGKNRKRRCNAHHQMKVSSDKRIARAAACKFATRKKYSREPTRQKERNKSQCEQHRCREARLRIPQRAEPANH